MDDADRLFWKVSKSSTYLGRLKNEVSILTANMESRRKPYPKDDVSSTCDAVPGGGEETDPELAQLSSLRTQIREVSAELEESFLKLAELDFSSLESQPSRDVLLDQCSVALEAVVRRYAEKWSTFLCQWNNTAELLVRFSSHLGVQVGPEGQAASSSSTSVSVLREGDRKRIFGARVNEREIRFADVGEDMDHFRATAMGAIESWSRERLEVLDYRRNYKTGVFSAQSGSAADEKR